MVASLSDIPELWVEACSDPATYPGAAPDLLLLQDADDRSGPWRLEERLRRLGACWPAARIIVLTGNMAAGVRLCRRYGVRVCMPLQAGLDDVAAAIRLARAGMIVYPATVPVEPASFTELVGRGSLNGAARPDSPR